MEYTQLLHRISDLAYLSTEPLPGERSGCMSSYDRRSVYDCETERYCHWDANQDDSGCLRRNSDGSIVAFECTGTGVIWRVWSALPQTGCMRVWIDEQSEPAIFTPFCDWFEREPNAVPPMNFTQLCLTQSRGKVSYIPIPFQTYCRVELLPNWGRFYHFTYTLFSSDVQLPAYHERYSREGRIALAALDRSLFCREGIQQSGERKRCVVRKHSKCTIINKRHSGALQELRFFPDELENLQEALQLLWIRIWWDHDTQASVYAPLGDFFGSAPGFHPHSSLPLSMEKRQYTCRWYMPFEQGMRLEVENHSQSDQKISFEWVFQQGALPQRAFLRFHAKWHAGYPDCPGEFLPGGMRWPDWAVLKVYGAKGRFCGMHLHVLNGWKEPEQPAQTWWYGNWGQKSIDWWWGEGDEKFFVDGEKTPSTFGTGTEDYIGYAWAAEPPFALFSQAFAAMSNTPLNGNGHTSVARYQIADNVPFQHQFEAYIEKYHADNWDGNVCLYGVTPFWYQEAGTADNCPLPNISESYHQWKNKERELQIEPDQD